MTDPLSAHARGSVVPYDGMVVSLARHPKSSTTLMFVWRPFYGHRLI